MLGHDGFKAQDASSQASEARPKSGILTPASQSSLNQEDSQLISRKRKRDGSNLEDLLSERFTVKPHPSTAFDKPRSMKPIALIPRASLSLSSLDTFSSSSNGLPQSRLFESHVKILELEHRMGCKPTVLIARLDDGKSFYAVEYDSRGRYALCKLGSWIDMERLCEDAMVSRYRPAPTVLEGQRQIKQEMASQNPQVTVEDAKYNKKKRLAIEAIQSMVKRPSGDSSLIRETPQTQETPQPNVPEVPEVNIELFLAVEEAPMGEFITPVDEGVSQSAGDILENIRSQYFEMLYLSKASTAYFAKGPLSRARAAYHLDYDSTLDMKDLVEFLDGLILPTATLDKKYKDAVPEFISKLDPGNESADEEDKPAESKKRKVKKIKLGKNGLYNTEDTFIRSWWSNHNADADLQLPGTVIEDTKRNRVSQLRIREAQLQMILILETLALQPLLASSAEDMSELPSAGLKDESVGDKTAARSKAKKPRDLPALIDVHVDRLCIWQSLSAEEGRTISKTVPMDKSSSKLLNPSLNEKHAADVLRDFCVEVIVPFFSARLPDLCKMICRKLGHRIASSPARPPTKKSASMSASTSRPGAATKRPITTNSRRTLQRVLTDERQARAGSRGPSGAISLMRSATAPTVPGLKREASETPSLNSIPLNDSQNLFASRAGVQKSKRFSQREVDLGAFKGIADPKPKINIEAELKDAILALKRPNRQLAGQSIVETAEKRVIAANSNSRKSKKPVRNPLFTGVQIIATPKNNRYKDMVGDSQSQPKDIYDAEAGVEPVIIPPSSAPRIPESAVRPNTGRNLDEGLLCEATPLKSRSESRLPAIQETPLKMASFGGFTSKPSSGHIAIPPSASPPPSRNGNSEQYLRVPSSTGFAAPKAKRKENQIICVTPVKNAQSTIDEFVTPLKPLNLTSNPEAPQVKTGFLEDEKPVEEDSIYKALGWDDMDDF